jgi:hypothetical protein
MNIKKKIINVIVLIALCVELSSAAHANHKFLNRTNDYGTTVTFPAGFVVGDYIEFVGVKPADAGSAGYYKISISYTRGNVAAAATHVASISHANPAIWREAGRENGNGYLTHGHNFTIDCNTDPANPRFRIRAVNTMGDVGSPLPVGISVVSTNSTAFYTPLSLYGHNQSQVNLLPMTNEWDLYVGNPYNAGGASIAIKALTNGNVGIGTATPTEKLSVNGNVRAREIKVENSNWPDYVFESGYDLPRLKDLKSYIEQNKHLPDIPSADQVKIEGLSLGEMNAQLLKKIEELTLYLLQKDQELQHEKGRIDSQQLQLSNQQKAIDTLMIKIKSLN